MSLDKAEGTHHRLEVYRRSLISFSFLYHITAETSGVIEAQPQFAFQLVFFAL